MSVSVVKAKTKEEFFKCWQKWCKCFDDDERNSINSQITWMLQDYAIWNLINKSRAYIKKDADGNLLANGMLHRTVDRWFFETQTIAIRRLIDESGLDGKRGVYSIVSLLNEMILNSEYFTRENLFEVRGLQYDYKSLIEAERKWVKKHSGGKYALQIPKELDSSPCVDLHELIDKLAGTSKEKRNQADAIDITILSNLKEQLTKRSDSFKITVDKFYAHAATKESLLEVDQSKLKLTLAEYKNVHELICKYADFLQIILMDKSNMYLPIPSPDFFLYWDAAIFQGEKPELLKNIWDEYDEEIKHWCSSPIDELIYEGTE